MELELRLVDVNSDSVSETWPLLLDSVEKAHFIALDLELSGLGNVLTQGGGLSVERRYSALCETVKSRAILSLGIACFQWTASQRDEKPSYLPHITTSPVLNSHNHEEPRSPKHCDPDESLALNSATSVLSNSITVSVDVFNIWLMCQDPYTIDPSSARFLLKHGFDFNKQFSKGLPYTPGPMKEQTMERGAVSVHSLLATILATRKPLVVHNGWIDLLFLYGNFYAPLPPSLGSLIADLVEMFECGVYDTKAIARFEIGEDATFLEYLFRKCQRDNEVLKTRGSPYLHLHLPSPPSSIPTELVPLYPSHTPSLEEAADTIVCDTFAKYGFCRITDCRHSHDVLVVLVQREHQLQIKQMKRKRKREQQRAKTPQLQGDCVPPSKQQCTRSNTTENATLLRKTDLIKEFASELEAARSKLSSTSHVPTSTSTASTSTKPSNSLASSTAAGTGLPSPITTQKPSFGHRAGFDAFMTGYVFAYYAVTQTKLDGPLSVPEALALDEAMIAGLSSMRNRLGNHNKTVPLILAKSQFAKTSQTHRENCAKVAEFEKLLHENSS